MTREEWEAEAAAATRRLSDHLHRRLGPQAQLPRWMTEQEIVMQWQVEATLASGARTVFGVSAPDYDAAWDLAAEMLPDMPAEDDENGFKFTVSEIKRPHLRERPRGGLEPADKDTH